MSSKSPSTRRAEPWSEERLDRELTEFLAEASEWPSYSEFQRKGKKAVRDAVNRFGGARRWAERLGVRYVERRPGYAPIWTDEKIRSDLRAFLRGKKTWPSRKDFEAAGLKTLRDAVLRTGGPERWAAEFGLPRRDERSGSRRVWTDERIERRLRTLLDGSDRWPSKQDFLDAGAGGLISAVYLHGGPDYWARRLGVTRARSSRPAQPTKWPEERIRDELRAFCAGRDDWPRFSEFVASGRRNLYGMASLRGGIDRWVRELGLKR